MIKVSEISEKLRTENLLHEIFSKDSDWDTLLDLRDSPEFDEAWSNAYAEVRAHGEESDTAKDIREFVFKEVLHKTGNSDLSGYVSDDFGLIIEAIEKNQINDFVKKIWQSYAAHEFPH